ncbi:MAG TPA: DUF86 domain-containing protein [bacterium]|nr:DUF86 domain-containing protein [bacterium]
MRPEDRDLSYIWDMLQAARDIVSFIEGKNFNKFEKDKLTRFAVERQLLVIGEAANHLSDGFQAAHAAIPWKRIIGLRNILAHDYGEILTERVWFTALHHIPELISQIEPLIPKKKA